MELRNIKTFARIAEVGSFTRVATELGYTQSAVTMQIKQLERELGWEPRHTDFAEGLKATIDWYVANEAWWRPAKAATEAKYAKQGQ